MDERLPIVDFITSIIGVLRPVFLTGKDFSVALWGFFVKLWGFIGPAADGIRGMLPF